MVTTIQHNIEAMNANRQMNITGGTLAKSARNLSSGYKINVAADDAAGLSISEKMRRQIRGLSQGVQNTEDSVSLCQVADGALSEVHDMLQRINELAIKAANDTNSESDRRCINDEVTQILAEIDRIGDTTKFNEIFIFRGMEKKTMTKFLTVGLDDNITVSKPNTVPTPPFDQINMDCELTAGRLTPGIQETTWILRRNRHSRAPQTDGILYLVQEARHHRSWWAHIHRQEQRRYAVLLLISPT